jgi:raffinose/stachyose/melibiose transport system permease protein
MLAFSVPATILYILFFIYPVGAGIYYSLTNWNGLTSNYHFVGIKNYVSALKSTRFQNAILFNFKYTILLVVSIVGISLIMALILNSKIKAKGFFRGVYFFPAVVSMLTVGLIFNEVFFQVLPQIGQILHIDWMSRSLLSGSKTAIYAILITNVWQGIAIPTVLLMAGLQNVPQELIESASLDGAKQWGIFKYITFPFLLPVLTVVMVLVIKDGLTIYDYIVALTNGGPGGATESAALLIYNHGFKEVNFSLGIAEAVIVTVIICSISFVQISLSNKKSVY